MHAAAFVQFCYALASCIPSGVKLPAKNVSGHFFLASWQIFSIRVLTHRKTALQKGWSFFHFLPSVFCIGCYEISSSHITGIPEGQFICLTLHKPSQKQMGLWDSQHIFALLVLSVIQNCAINKEGSRGSFRSDFFFVCYQL